MRNATILGVYISSSHADNRKNNFLVLGKGLTDYINGSIGTTGKKFSINFNGELWQMDHSGAIKKIKFKKVFIAKTFYSHKKFIYFKIFDKT